ncbi:MAG: hypothetical protein EOO10_04180 [Chitinophagaceae bacterium]|nr:MAG: hypothetical protein EOO10_04180 [Chitinophagaceae bacterium]
MKVGLIIFTIGVLFGLFLSLMWRTLTINVPISPAPTVSPVELKKEVQASETIYAKSYDSLQNKSVVLIHELIDTKSALKTAKLKNLSLQSKVKSLVTKRNENKLSARVAYDASCDSLITTVEYLMQSSSEKDSLYEKVTVNLEQQIKNKDSTITLKDNQYGDIKSVFEKSIAAQQTLLDENQLLGKQVKKQKFKSKVLSAVLFIFSGAAINHLIRH